MPGEQGGGIRSCMYCGRDTRARGGVCAGCCGKPLSASKAVEPEDQEEFPPSAFSDQQYHGDTDRDDL